MNFQLPRILRRRPTEQVRDEEMQFHLEQQIKANLRAGMDPDEARRQALIEFGGVQQTREALRNQSLSQHLAKIFQDLRYGSRILRKSPGFTLIAVLMLALGIGANTAIFSTVSAAIFPQWDVSNAGQLVVVREATQSNPGYLISIPDFQDYGKSQHSFDQLSLWITQSINLTGTERPDRLIGGYVSANFFEMLGMQAAMGRSFMTGEDEPGAARVAVLSYAAWQNRFGSDPGILGRQLVLNNEPYSVIGVLPRTMDVLPFSADVFITAQHHPNYNLDRANQPLLVFARIRDGISRSQAAADLEVTAQRLAREYPQSNAGIHIELDTLRQMFTGRLRTPMLFMLGAVALLLLIVCANLANLLLARGLGRQREVAVRGALGATRRRLVTQFLSESLLLSLAGGIAGILLALLLDRIIRAISPLGLPESGILNVKMLGFTFCTTVITGVVFGLVPALQYSHTPMTTVLGAGARAVGHSRGRLRSVFVVSQLALTVVLLVNADLLIRSFHSLISANPGFKPDHLLTMEYRLPRNKYTTPEAQWNFHREMLAQVQRLPGVSSAAIVQALPLSGNWGQINFDLPERPASSKPFELAAVTNIVTPGYFSTIGIPLLQGRWFMDQDEAKSQAVVIVNREFAKQFLHGKEALGHEVVFNSNPAPRVSAPARQATIVGVVGDSKQLSRREPDPAQIYFPYAQTPGIFGTLVVRTQADPLSLSEAVRQAVWSVDKDQPVWKVRTLDSLMQNDVAPDRFLVFMISAFGFLALALSCMGTYAMLSNGVQQRFQELAVRMALGASPARVLRLVLLQGLKVTLIGGALGVVGAMATTRLLASVLFGVTPRDTVSFLSGWGLLTLIALLAAYIPARMATRVNPMTVLRLE